MLCFVELPVEAMQITIESRVDFAHHWWKDNAKSLFDAYSLSDSCFTMDELITVI